MSMQMDAYLKKGQTGTLLGRGVLTSFWAWCTLILVWRLLGELYNKGKQGLNFLINVCSLPA